MRDQPGTKAGGEAARRVNRMHILPEGRGGWLGGGFVGAAADSSPSLNEGRGRC